MSARLLCKGSVMLMSILFSAFNSFSQKISEADAVALALENNQLIKAAEVEVEYFRQMKKTGSELGKFSVVWMNGQYNTAERDNNLTITQSIPFPGTLSAAIKLGEEHIVGADKSLLLAKSTLVFNVKSAYEILLFQNAIHELLLSQDSLYSDFAKASAIRYKTGESNLLEMTSAETQLLENKNNLRVNESEIFSSQKQLQILLKTDAPVETTGSITRRQHASDLLGSIPENNAQIQLAKQQVKINQQVSRLERSKLFPDFTVGYFNQTLIGYQNTTGTEVYYGKSNRFQGFTAGIQIPLWFAPQVARAKASSYMEESSRHAAAYTQNRVYGEFEQGLRDLSKNEASLNYYETSALKNADLILSQSLKAYRGGEIGYVEYLQSLRTALSIKSNYLQALHQYNLSVIRVEFLSGTY